MKRITAIALFAVACTLGAGHALAQARAVRATMPFDFTVGNKLLPAGTYTIIPVSDDAIEIQNSNTHFAILSTATPDSELKTGCNLVFDKYADRYFLREVAGGANAFQVDLPSTKSEEKARSVQTMARNQSQVVVAASEGN